MEDARRHPHSNSSLIRILAVAAPLAWALVVLFHPMPGEGGPFEAIRDDVNRWLFVHIGQLVLTPFLFLAVWRLLDGLSSTVARVSRCALVVWTVFFSAYDSVQGVATGILIRYGEGLAGEEQAAVAKALEYVVEDSQLAGNYSFLGLVAGAAWLTCAIAAAVALQRAGAGRAVVIAACVSTVFALHIAPAAIGLVALAIAVGLREKQRSEPEAIASRTALASP